VKCTSIKEQAPNADGLKASLIVPLPILFYLVVMQLAAHRVGRWLLRYKYLCQGEGLGFESLLPIHS